MNAVLESCCVSYVVDTTKMCGPGMPGLKRASPLAVLLIAKIVRTDQPVLESDTHYPLMELGSLNGGPNTWHVYAPGGCDFLRAGYDLSEFYANIVAIAQAAHDEALAA